MFCSAVLSFLVSVAISLCPLDFFFFNLMILTSILLCHSSIFLIWEGMENAAHDLGPSKAAAFSLELESLRVLQKCTLHCSAVARYTD